MSSSQSIVEALRPFTPCDCSDALLKLNYRNGGFLSGPTMWSPQRQEGSTKIIGPAYTVKYALLSDPAPKVAAHYIDSIPEGAVVFISCPPDIPNAVYGGLVATRSKVSKAAGTVVDGRIRDLQQMRNLKYPVFARDIGTTAPYELVKVTAVNEPVHLQSPIQDMIINPGDYIVGDIDGVVVVPKDMVVEVIPLLGPQVEADEKMAEAIKGGMSFTEVGKKFRAKVGNLAGKEGGKAGEGK